ncbi:MAG: hypothetical protein ACK4NF_05600, partial [Planctomycetota bacterium]
MGRRKEYFYFLINILLLPHFLHPQFYSVIPKKHLNNFGIYIYDLTNKKEVFVLNKNKSFIPASNMKLLLLGALIFNIDISSNLCNKFYISDDGGNLEINIVGGCAFNFDSKKVFEEFELFYQRYKDYLNTKRIKRINLDSGIFDNVTYNQFWKDYEKLEWWLPAVSP